MSVLSQVPIFIDDSGSITVTEIRSRCRRLQSAEGLSAVFIDYLQLLRPGTMTRSQNRNDELSEICRMLKATAKDLQVPIVALAQLNRGVESRNDKRPMLSDLRDCLAGESLVTNADTGDRHAMAEIVEKGLRFNVWATDDRLQLVRRPITDAWLVGTKPVFAVTTQSGRKIRCTDGHRFLTVAGWKKLGEMTCGDSLAVPSRDAGESDDYLPPRAPIGGSPGGVSVRTSPSETLDALSFSEIAWDPIALIEACGPQPVFDLTVGDLHNFCVDDIVTHNSGAIEQEADMVAFLYREAYYNPESAPEPDLTEFIIAKQRNGPTGTVKLRFLKEYTLFVPYGESSHFSAP